MKKVTLVLTILLCLFTCLSSNAQDKKGKHDNCYNYQRGVEYLNNNDDENAEKCFQAEVKEHKDNGLAWAKLGQIYGNHNEWGTALTYTNNAIKYTKDKDAENQAYNYYVRGFIYKNLDDSVKAVKDYDKAVSLQPENALYYQKRGEFYLERHDYAQCMSDFQKVIELDPGNATGNHYLGACYEFQEQYDKALENYNRAIKLEPNNGIILCDFGDVYLKTKKYNLAADYFIQALSISDNNMNAMNGLFSTADSAFAITNAKLKVQMAKNPNIALWPLLLGAIHENNLNDYKTALEYYEKAATITSDAFTSSNIANCHYQLGNYSKAIEYINEALKEVPKDKDYLYKKANYCRLAYQNDSALAAISKYIEVAPESPAGYSVRADIYEEMKNHTAALEDANMAVSLADDYYYYYYDRGTIYLKLGKMDEAKADFNKEIQLDSLNKSAMTAYCYLYTGNNEKAIAIIDSIMATDADENAYYNGACIYSLMGNKEKALECLKSSLENGYNEFGHLDTDTDLDNIRQLPEFKKMVDEYKAKNEKSANVEDDAQYETVTSDIPYTKKGGITEVKCTVNDLPLHFVFDTGASDVTISNIEAAFMLKNGYLSQQDIVGTSYYSDANGDVSEGTVIVLKKVVFGDITLENVRASVVHTQNAPLLLGQSVFQKLGKIEIDNVKKVIHIIHKKKVNKQK